MKRLLIVSLMGVGFLAAPGCTKTKPAATAPASTNSMASASAAPSAEAPKPLAPEKDSDANVVNASVDERIVKLCDLREARFEFNSAAIGSDARSVLDAIARCFADGAGKGKNMNLVGHADPRGEEEYNFALGQRRAGAVVGYLKKAGLGDERMSSTSRGELDATGTDEAGWSRDRRVEIRLAP